MPSLNPEDALGEGLLWPVLLLYPQVGSGVITLISPLEHRSTCRSSLIMQFQISNIELNILLYFLERFEWFYWSCVRRQLSCGTPGEREWVGLHRLVQPSSAALVEVLLAPDYFTPNTPTPPDPRRYFQKKAHQSAGTKTSNTNAPT